MGQRCISNESLGTTGFSYTLSLINGKYKMTILYTLMEFGVVRFNEMKREARVNGLIPADALEALLFIFEHELCHVIEFMQYGRTSCRGKRFLELAHALFGHTGTTHALPTAGEVAQRETGLAPGSRVSFVYQGQVLTGVVNYIGKKATVMVRDAQGSYMDRQGNRYTKYYVALQRLKI